MNEEKILNLQQKIVYEQETHTQTEEQLIKLKIDFENMKQEMINATEKDNQTTLMKSKNEEIERQKKEILQEQQIVAHVQVTQEKEIIEKEKETFILNTILKQERQAVMEKEREKEKLSNLRYQVKYAHTTAKSNHIFRLELMMQNLLHQDRQETKYHPHHQLCR